MRSIMFIFLTMLVSGCAHQMKNVHPEWNEGHTMEAAEERCYASSKAAFAYDEILLRPEQRRAYVRCMAFYGFEFRRSDS